MADRVTRSRRQIQLAQQQREEQSRARWTNGLTKIFADLMVDQIRTGNRVNNSFSKKSWELMCDGFYEKTGLRWDKEQLKNRFSVMRKQHAIVKFLLSRKGFRLDESTGTIVASNEAWAECLKEHPDAESIRSSGCPIYRQLGIIFYEPLTNGKHEQSAEEDREIHSAVSGKEPLNTIPEGESSSESEEAEEVAEDRDAEYQTPTNGGNANRKRGRRGIDDAIAGAILHMAAASKLRTDAVSQINARYSIADCIKELDSMQGIEQEVYFAALDLFKKPNAREIFLSLKGDKRSIWLHAKCTSQQTRVVL